MKINEIPQTEGLNESSLDLDMMSTSDIIRIMNSEDRKAVDAVGKASGDIERAIGEVVGAFKSGGRLFYVGAGTSGRLGVLDASECPPTFSVSPEMVQGIIAGGDYALRRAVEGAEDDGEDGRKAVRLHGVEKKDMVIGISTSGLAAFVSGALQEAKERGSRAWLLTCNPRMRSEEELKYLDGVIVLDTGPEVISGSTRLKGGTATKLVLNMITTISMIRIGKVFGNLMVDVAPTNRKLRDRAGRIISRVTGCGMEEAAGLLKAAGNRPKVAIVMKMRNVDAAEAESILSDCGGFLRKAIG